MLGNALRSAKFRLQNATVDRCLYNRDFRFVPTEQDVADRRQLASRTEAENRLLGQFLDYTAAAVGNRAEFDAKWSRAKIAYEAADATRAEALAQAEELRDDVTIAKQLPTGERSNRLSAIRQRTREAFSASGQPIGAA